MTLFRTPAHYPFSNENFYFWPQIAESANIAEKIMATISMIPLYHRNFHLFFRENFPFFAKVITLDLQKNVSKLIRLRRAVGAAESKMFTNFTYFLPSSPSSLPSSLPFPLSRSFIISSSDSLMQNDGSSFQYLNK
jgi:hypothetical protein